MRWLIIALMFLLSSCAYGMYDQNSGLFWATESPLTQMQRQQNAINAYWSNWQYQKDMLFQMQQLNMQPYLPRPYGY